MSSRTHKPVLLFAVFTLLVAIVLSACTQQVTPTQSAGPAKPAAEASKSAEQSAKPTSVPKPEQQPAEQAAAKAQPAASTKPPIKIGLLDPFTGSFALDAKDNQDGHMLYLEKIGNQVAGRKIELVAEDTEAKGDVALTKARKLVENDKVNMVVGTISSAECYAVAPYFAEKKVPFIVTGNCGAEGLTKDPKMRSPYIWRTTQTSGMLTYPLSEYLIKNNVKKVVFIATGFAGGYEVADGFAHSFIDLGGTIVQEIYPAMGTTDFGPFMGQIKGDADAVVGFVIGTDGLRLAQQYAEYGWKDKLPLYDISEEIASGPNVAQLKDAAVGIMPSIHYADDLDTPENQQFRKEFETKYKDRIMGHALPAGYAGMQVIATALQTIDANIEDVDKFLGALKKVDIHTPKGHFKFDDYQNVVEDFYIKKVEKVGGNYVYKTLFTRPDVTQFWNWKPDELIKYPYGKLFGKYTNINKEQLDALIKTNSPQ